MRKEWVIMFLFFMFSLSFVSAQTSQNSAVQCLEKRVGENTISLEEAVFSMLAGVDIDKTESVIDVKKDTSAECWPAEHCTVKDTAQVIIAKRSIGKPMDDALEWLKSKNGASKNLNWFLQVSIDGNVPTHCEFNDGSSSGNIEVGEDLKLSSNNFGSCFELTPLGYWLNIRPTCFDKSFDISCDVPFKTNLFYRKEGSEVNFISAQTHSGSGGKDSFTTEKINARCFKNSASGDCDYEGSLWAATALYKSEEDYSEFVPYLRALSLDNKKYFPSAFLYYLLESDLKTEVIALRQPLLQGALWDISGSPNTKFYDTALGLMALGGVGSGDNAGSDGHSTINTLYELQEGDDEANPGCWGNIRDTAFLIYATQWNGNVAPGSICSDVGGSCKDSCDSGEYSEDNAVCDSASNLCCRVGGGTSIPPGSITCDAIRGVCGTEACGNGTLESDALCSTTGESCCAPESSGSSPTQTNCALVGFSCVSNRGACIAAGGEEKPDPPYSCNFWSDVCCTIAVDEAKTCTELQGTVCAWDEECSGSLIPGSTVSNCCRDSCEKKVEPECSSNEDCLSDEICSSGSCISASAPPADKKGMGTWTIIILLLVLICLVSLGIIYRDKLRFWLLKIRGKVKTNKVGPNNVPFSGVRPVPRRRTPLFGRRPSGIIPRGRMPPQPRRRLPSSPFKKSAKDEEMEETMKKLREMSK